MNPGRCPPDEALCELFDGEADTRAAALQRHVASCPRCEARLAAFGEVRQQLLPLKQSALEPGIAQAVLLRLPREVPKPLRAGRPWVGVRVAGGVAALAAGAVLGMSLVVGGAVADRTGISVFSAEPARQLCAGLPACGR